jgi:probable DNA repair protein
MSLGSDTPLIAKPELVAELERARATTVVTPNQRMAAALARDFDAHQLARGIAVWAAPDILPLQAFVERAWADLLYTDLAISLPLLLSPEQEQALWANIIGASKEGEALLAQAQTAASCRDAWQIAHAFGLAHRLRSVPLNDDTRAFIEWSSRYERICRKEQYTDRARLPDRVAPQLSHPKLKRPDLLVAYGFDIVTPQQSAFLEALAAAGCALRRSEREPRAAAAHRIAYTAASEEMFAAAKWARARLEANPGARIGIVVPEFERQRKAIGRIFAQVCAPERALPGADQARMSLPFNLSLGEPLASYPLVQSALALLELAGGAQLTFARASGLLRSPFLAGGEAEAISRARLDAELRRAAAATQTLSRLVSALARIPEHCCPILAQCLARLLAFGREQLSGSKPASEWGARIGELLKLAGFPGERGLDSAEYQTLKKLHDALGALGAIERVLPRMRYRDALEHLRRIAADTLFQPEAPEVPIQILGVLESAGLAFEHLWVMGLTDEVWPMHARPNPYIPVVLQREAQVPQSSASHSLELDRRITRGWLASAGELVFSHPLRDGDRELMASPLIQGVPESEPAALALRDYARYRDALHASRAIERLPDTQASHLGTELRGGTGIFRDQAACPFRAFAIHRLGATGLEAPEPGLNAADRGTLVHAMLARVWSEIGSKSKLDSMSPADLEALLSSAAAHAIERVSRRRPDALERAFAALEAGRLARLAREWLDIERERADFEVRDVEQKRSLTVGGVTVRARLDRLDALASGGCVIIDYKTGKANASDWFGARPDEPQLPLYALATDDLAALAYARVQAGEMKFEGVGRDEGMLPGVVTVERKRSALARPYGSWQSLLAGWRRDLEQLGSEFAAGEARVDPKQGSRTCEHCELHPLCRVNERAEWGPTGGGEDTRDD